MGRQQIMLSVAIGKYHEWQRYEADHTENTVASARWVLKRFLREVKDKQLASLTERHVREYFKRLNMPHSTGHDHYRKMNPPVSPGAFNFQRQRVKAFLDWARDEGYLAQNLMRNIRPKEVPRKKRQRPAPHVLMSLLDVADGPRDRAYIAVAINTGLRASEIGRIQVGQVDLDSGFLTSVIIKKTGDIDDQPITSDLDPELRGWLAEYEQNLGRPLDPEEYLFPHVVGTLLAGCRMVDGKREPIRTPQMLVPDKMIAHPEKIVQKALGSLNLPIKYEGIHTVRRAVARAFYDMLVARGVNDVDALRQTQSLLHHSLVATTERYLGLDIEREKRNRNLRGRPFLSEIIAAGDNVIPLRPTASQE